MASPYKQTYGTGESPPIKAGHWGTILHLESTYTGFSTSARRRSRPSAGPEKSQLLQIPPSLNSKAVLQRVRLLFLLRQHFCGRQRFWMRQTFSICQRFWMRQSFSIHQNFGCSQTLSIRQRFWMRQTFNICQRFWMRQAFRIRQRFWMRQTLCIYFAVPIFLRIFLHFYLICANNLIGANVLRLLGQG
jgi:hypothetical protein